MQTTDRDFCKMFLYTYIIADFVEKSRREMVWSLV